MKLIPADDKCPDGKNCPQRFFTDRGTIVIQGYKVTDPEARAQLAARGMPDGEDVVEIPLELWEAGRR